MNKNQINRMLFLLLLISILGLSCTTMQQIMNASQPDVKVHNVRLTGISFEDIDLAFDIKVLNPNPFSAAIAGFDYDFQIDNASFLKGNKTDQLSIQANGESIIEIPLTLGFKDLYQTYKALTDKDSSNYNLITTFYFDLPILGRTPITVNKDGNLPLIKLPSINVSSLKLKKINFTGADLELTLDMVNPNSFQLFLDRLQYDFSINGMKWASGVTQNQTKINDKNKARLAIPISLDFLQMGRTVYNLLQGNTDLDYTFNSNLDLNSSIPLLKEVNLPFNKAGKINLIK